VKVRALDLSKSQLWAGSFIASLVGHVVVVGLGLRFSTGFGAPASGPIATTSEANEVAVEVATSDSSLFRAGPALGRTRSLTTTPFRPIRAPGGGEPLARPDMDRPGRGGSLRADDAALNLADRNDGLTLSRDVTSRIDRDQIQASRDFARPRLE